MLRLENEFGLPELHFHFSSRTLSDKVFILNIHFFILRSASMAQRRPLVPPSYRQREEEICYNRILLCVCLEYNKIKKGSLKAVGWYLQRGKEERQERTWRWCPVRGKLYTSELRLSGALNVLRGRQMMPQRVQKVDMSLLTVIKLPSLPHYLSTPIIYKPNGLGCSSVNTYIIEGRRS